MPGREQAADANMKSAAKKNAANKLGAKSAAGQKGSCKAQ
jgi:hypothetical protein